MNTKKPVEGVVNNPEIEESINSMVPAMNVEVPTLLDNQKDIISDNDLLGIYDEILVKIREDRGEIDSVLSQFINMVINDGDSTTSSKEALVNLLKMKSDQADKMSKVADLMTRVKMKDRFSPGGPWLNASQTNNINIGNNKRSILEAFHKAKRDK